MITAAMDLFEEADQEAIRRDLPAQARLFLDAVNEAASKYHIPAYTAIVMVPEMMTASVGGYSNEACSLLAEVNIQLVDKIRELVGLYMTEYHGKPS